MEGKHVALGGVLDSVNASNFLALRAIYIVQKLNHLAANTGEDNVYIAYCFLQHCSRLRRGEARSAFTTGFDYSFWFFILIIHFEHSF